ncbi:hypothetical protein DFH11DRAFT_1766735 [Phellopilus nigrolimitatus]|nr:hypothetical protein DFH11DRAFT_1766735 [Phellopilus nigrolimitatus]
MPFQGQIPGFSGSFEPMSGSVLAREQNDSPLAELFHCEFTGEKAGKYKKTRAPRPIADILELRTDRHLYLQTAIKLNNDPLGRKESRTVRDVLTLPNPDPLQRRSLAEWLTVFLANIDFIFRCDSRISRSDRVAQMVIKRGTNCEAPKERLFNLARDADEEIRAEQSAEEVMEENIEPINAVPYCDSAKGKIDGKISDVAFAETVNNIKIVFRNGGVEQEDQAPTSSHRLQFPAKN